MSALPQLPATVRSCGYGAPQDVVLPHPGMLPKQPGNNWDDTAFKKRHSRRQALSAEGTGNFGKAYQNTFVRTAAPEPEISSASRRLQECLAAAGTVPDTPQKTSVTADRVLRFYGFWCEAPVESAAESKRVRKVTLCFYPSDETLMLSEPRTGNSGLQGGTLLKRHRVLAQRSKHGRTSAAEDEPEHITVDDLNVGEEVVVHGKHVHLYGCDSSTREFLSAMGVDVPPDGAAPDDEYFTEYRGKRVDPRRAVRNYEDFDMRMTFEQQSKGRVVKHYPGEIQRVRKFLRDGGKVCRFWAFWDDVHNPHGDLRRYEVRYFIEDDTMEVIERLPPNSGREQTRAFCRRCRLPRQGDQQRKGLELTFAGRVNGMRHDAPLPGSTDEDSFFSLKDLDVGTVVNVYGRALQIYGADQWTREYYSTVVGREVAPDAAFPGVKEKGPAVVVPGRHNGYGTEEDSLGNCMSLVLKPPKQDLRRWQTHADDVQRFKLAFHNPADANDVHRRFVLSVHMADDTLTINEVSIRNSGFLAGRFLKRQRVKKYRSEGPGTFFSAPDFFPGAVVNLSGHTFEVLEMDKRTETLKDVSLQVDREVTAGSIALLTQRLRNALLTKHMTLTAAFRHYDRDRDGVIALHEFKGMLASLHMDHLQEPEAIAMMQQWNTSQDGRLTLNQFVQGVTGNTLKSFLDGRDAEYKLVDGLDGDKEPFLAVAASRPAEHERSRILRIFKESLEGRQINVFEMYRMLSTMPASYSARPSGVKDAECLTSGGADSLLGPVQLRRGIEERFNLGLSEAQLDDLVSFFFPTLPKELMKAPRSKTQEYRLSLAAFQGRWNAMEQLGQLPVPDGLDAHALGQF